MQAESNWNDAQALDEVRKRRFLIDRCDAYLFHEIAPYIGRRVLEVGCGHGNLVAKLLDRELVVATDLEAGSVAEVNRRFGSCGTVVALQCDVTDLGTSDLQRYACDTVVCLNVLEHIQDDEKALSNIAGAVVPNGYVIIIVPAFQALYGSMDSSIGHFRRYSIPGFQRKLQSAGLTVQRQYHINILGTLGWFVNGRILHREVPPSSQLRLFNLVYPFVSRVESVMPHVAGLSLVSISQRKT